MIPTTQERQLPVAWQMPCHHFEIFGESQGQHWKTLAKGLNTSRRLLPKASFFKAFWFSQ